MHTSSRRTAVTFALGLLVASPARSAAPTPSASEATREKQAFVVGLNKHWKAEDEKVAAEARAAEKRGEFSSLAPPRELGRFKDWDYYYLKGSSSVWRPNPGQAFKAVTVPVGFVTDLTSIPQGLWSFGLRPEGPHSYAAIIHDWLYWTQERPREEADQILLFALEDSKVDAALRNRIYNAVRLAGGLSWDKNADLKRSGEKRLLKRFPSDFTVSWAEWKKTPGVFAD
jgi:hypothetical protein